MNLRVGIALVSTLCTACLGSTYEQKQEISEVSSKIKLGMQRAAVEELAESSGADQVYQTDVGSPLDGPFLQIAKEKDFCSTRSRHLVLVYWQGARAFLSTFDVYVVVDFDANDVVCGQDVVSVRL